MMAQSRTIVTVFNKEFLDGVRDTRAVFSALIFPLFAPFLVYGLVLLIAMITLSEKETVIPVLGMEHAPALMQFLEEEGITLKVFTDDPVEALREKTEKIVLRIPENYGERLRQTRTAIVQVYTDASRSDTVSEFRRLEELILRYNNEVAALRLIARGVSPEVIRVVSAQGVNTASKQQLAVAALSFLPLYVLLAAFVSGMGVAVDSTAGERERKTLESLLVNPVERWAIVVGKWFSAAIFSAAGMILTLNLCLVALLHAPLDDLGLKFEISAREVLLISLSILPAALFVTSIQMFVGIFAKSFKDAQTFIGMLNMLPVVPYVIMLVAPFTPKIWMYAVPMLGQLILMTDVLGMKEVAAIAYIISFCCSILFGTAFVFATARLLERESVI